MRSPPLIRTIFFAITVTGFRGRLFVTENQIVTTVKMKRKLHAWRKKTFAKPITVNAVCLPPQNTAYYIDHFIVCFAAINEYPLLLTDCKIDQIKCDSGRCVSKAYVCDGEQDCKDGSDEPKECEKFTCAVYLNVTNSAKLCDFRQDCVDKSDEDGSKCLSGCDPDRSFHCAEWVLNKFGRALFFSPSLLNFL